MLQLPIIRRIKKHLQVDMSKIIMTMSAGAFLGQLVTILSAPILSRIYDPEDYGVLGIYMLVASLVTSIATLQYGHIIITSQEDEEAIRGLAICMYLPIPFAVLLLVAASFYGELINAWFKHPDAANWVLLTPISVLVGCANSGLSFLANRQAKYKLLTITRLLTGVLTVAASIALGLIYNGPLGLVIGFQIGQLFPSAILFYLLIWRPRVRILYPLGALLATAVKFKRLPLFTAPSDLLNSFASQLPVAMLGRVSAAEIGNYNLSARLLGMPLTVVSSSITEAFRQKASVEYATNGNCQSSFLKTFTISVAISFLPFVIIGLFSPACFAFLFSAKWRDAGYVSQILAPLYFARFVASPLAYMFIVSKRQREDLIVQISSFLITLLGFVACQWTEQTIYVTLGVFSAIGCSMYAYYGIRSYQLAMNRVTI